jgi:hypothetical protein
MIEAEKVHEADRDFPYSVWRMRVPGGWLYQITGTCPVFVADEPMQTDAKLNSSVKFIPLTKK